MTDCEGRVEAFSGFTTRHLVLSDKIRHSQLRNVCTPDAYLISGDSRIHILTPPPLEPQSDRMNMATQDPKKENL